MHAQQDEDSVGSKYTFMIASGPPPLHPQRSAPAYALQLIERVK
jgi:hypothetical protein